MRKKSKEDKQTLEELNLAHHRSQAKCQLVQISYIDPMQKWLPLTYSFVRIQNSLTNLVRDSKFFTIFSSKTRLVRLIYIRTKE